MVGMARCAVPARVVAGGTNIGATLAIEGVAPLHAARTSQHDVPTTLNTYSASRRKHSPAHERTIECRLPRIRNQSAGRRLERPRRSRSGCMTRICTQFVLLGFSHKKYLRNLDITDSAIVVLFLDSLYVLFV